MNNYYLSHRTAIEVFRYLRISGNLHYLKQSNLRCIKDAENCTKFLEFDFMLSTKNSTILDLLVENRKKWHHSKNANFHLCTAKLPANSLLKYKQDYYITSPEFTFCQLASSFTFPELMLLGLEMCGSYAICDNLEKGFVDYLCNITTAKKIKNYVRRLNKSTAHMQGAKKALEVANYLQDGSASPQESRLYTMLAAPHKYGGYGVRGLKFNTSIELSKTAASIYGYKSIKPDILNSKTKLAIEYDSNFYHDNMNQNQKDKRRIDALHHDSWQTFNFVNFHFSNLLPFDSLARDVLIANRQDARIRKKFFEVQRDALFKSLYTYL